MTIIRHATVYESNTDGIALSGLRPSGAQSCTDVVIPAAQDYAIISISFYSGTSGQHPTSVTLDSQAATLIVAADSDTSNLQTAIYYVAGFSSGSGKTVAWTNPVTMTDGVQVSIAFFTGGDISSGTTSLIRDSKAASHATHAVTATMTAQSGDYIVQSACSDATAITWDHGAGVATIPGGAMGMGEFTSPSGNTTMGATGTTIGFAAIVMKPAGAGGTYNARPLLQWYRKYILRLQ